MRAYWSGSNFYSRQGHMFHAPDFFKEDLPKIPLDGELWFVFEKEKRSFHFAIRNL